MCVGGGGELNDEHLFRKDFKVKFERGCYLSNPTYWLFLTVFFDSVAGCFTILSGERLSQSVTHFEGTVNTIMDDVQEFQGNLISVGFTKNIKRFSGERESDNLLIRHA